MFHLQLGTTFVKCDDQLFDAGDNPMLRITETFSGIISHNGDKILMQDFGIKQLEALNTFLLNKGMIKIPMVTTKDKYKFINLSYFITKFNTKNFDIYPTTPNRSDEVVAYVPSGWAPVKNKQLTKWIIAAPGSADLLNVYLLEKDTFKPIDRVLTASDRLFLWVKEPCMDQRRTFACYF